MLNRYLITFAAFIVGLNVAFAGSLNKLTRTEVENLLTGGNYTLISGGRNMNDPVDSLSSDRFISRRTKALKRLIEKKGHRFQVVVGKYGVIEESFLVLDTINDEDFLLKLGRKFKQESIILGNTGLQKMIYTTGDKAGKAYFGMGHVFFDSSQTDYFTQIITSEGDILRFSLNFDFENLCPNQRLLYEPCLQIAL
jgi:hypothetical protein